MKLTIDAKKNLVKEIDQLSKDQHLEIYKIVNGYTDKYTQNDNGIFINLSVLNDNILNKIKQFVDYCIYNRDTMEKDEELIRSEKDKIKNKNIFDDQNPMTETNNENVQNNDTNKESNEELNKESNNGINNGINNGSNNGITNDDNMNDEDDESEGAKISLKRLKPKYVGIKAKIIKNYKQNSLHNVSNIIHKNKKKNVSQEHKEMNDNLEYDVGEETYENDENDENDVNDDDEDDTCIENSGELLDDNDDE